MRLKTLPIADCRLPIAASKAVRSVVPKVLVAILRSAIGNWQLAILLLLVVVTMSCSKDQQQSSRKQLTVAAMAGPEGEALKQAALDYEAQTGVHLSITEFPYANLFDKEMIDLNARTGAYDLIMLDDPWFPIFASKQFLTELTPLLQKRGQFKTSMSPVVVVTICRIDHIICAEPYEIENIADCRLPIANCRFQSSAVSGS